VAKALSRKHVEIVERNLDQGYFYVEYDPDAKKMKSKTYWDELVFLFGDDPSNEIEYRVSLSQVKPKSTEISIQDIKGEMLSNKPAGSLLQLIADGVNQDELINSSENSKHYQ
jgi:outer membrane protein assembly factor BamC